MNADHVLLTRFNLPSAGVESVIRARDGWLRDRIALFERYTVPSVAAQTNRDVRWIVYLDPESPDWLLDRIRPHSQSGLLRPVLRASVSREELLQDIRGVLGSPRDVLITSNLDNDDGLACDYSERLLAVESPHPRAVIYLTKGIVHRSETMYLNVDKRNAFCAVRETWDQPVTCWSDFHTELAHHMPAIELHGPPAWLQVVHGANVSNRVRGRLVSPRGYERLFPSTVAACEPGRTAILRDRVIAHPARTVRDTLRAVARTQGIRLLGTQRYEHAKYLLSTAAARRRGPLRTRSSR